MSLAPPSQSTIRNRFSQPVTGSFRNRWGSYVNQNLELMDQALDGVTALAAVAATVTLTSLNGFVDQSRNRILEITGSAASAMTVVVPGVQKLYGIVNASTVTVNVGTVAGAQVSIPPASNATIVCDGSDTTILSISTAPPVPFRSVSSSQPIQSSDGGGVVAVGGGGGTLSLPLLATVPSGWFVDVSNRAGDGLVAVQPTAPDPGPARFGDSDWIEEDGSTFVLSDNDGGHLLFSGVVSTDSYAVPFRGAVRFISDGSAWWALFG